MLFYSTKDNAYIILFYATEDNAYIISSSLYVRKDNVYNNR
jgi:hypothetical protein